MDERCELTDLITAQCAHCRTPSKPVFTEALFTVPKDDGNEPVATFPARYAGRCADCDGFFEAGDWISRTGQGEYICDECGT